MILNRLFDKATKMQEWRTRTVEKLDAVTEEIKAESVLQSDDVTAAVQTLEELYSIQEEIIADLQQLCGGERGSAIKLLDALCGECKSADLAEFIRFLSITSDTPEYRAAIEDFQAAMLSSFDCISGEKAKVLALINQAVDLGKELNSIKAKLRGMLIDMDRMTIYAGLIEQEYRFESNSAKVEKIIEPEKHSGRIDVYEAALSNEDSKEDETYVKEEQPMREMQEYEQATQAVWKCTKPLKVKKMLGDFANKGSSGWRVHYTGEQHLYNIVKMLYLGVVTEATVDRIIGADEKDWLYNHGYISRLDILDGKTRVMCISNPGCAILNQSVIRSKIDLSSNQKAKSIAVSAEEDYVLRALAACEALAAVTCFDDISALQFGVDTDKEQQYLRFMMFDVCFNLYITWARDSELTSSDYADYDGVNAILKSELIFGDDGAVVGVNIYSDNGQKLSAVIGRVSDAVDDFIFSLKEDRDDVNSASSADAKNNEIIDECEESESDVNLALNVADAEQCSNDEEADLFGSVVGEEGINGGVDIDKAASASETAEDNIQEDNVEVVASTSSAENDMEELSALTACERDYGSIECLCERLADGDPKRDARDFYELALMLIADGREYDAQLLLGSLAHESEGYNCLFRHLRYITGDSVWGTEDISEYSKLQNMTFPEAFSDIEHAEQSIRLAGRLVYLAFFAKNDFDVKTQQYVSAEGVATEDLENSCKILLKTLGKLDIPSGGYTARDILAATNAQAKLKEYQALAADLINRPYTGLFDFKLKGPFFNDKILKPCLEAVKNNNESNFDIVKQKMSEIDDDDFGIDDDKLNAHLDKIWKEANRGGKKEGEALVDHAREQAYMHLRERVDLINDWLGLHSSRADSDNAKNKNRAQIIAQAQNVLNVDVNEKTAAIVKLAAKRIVRFVNGEMINNNARPPEKVLLSNEFVIDEHMQLAGVTEFADIVGLEPWRSAVRHIELSSKNAELPIAELLVATEDDTQIELFGNETTRKSLCTILNKEYEPLFDSSAALKRKGNKAGAEFKSRIEKEYLYGRIDESDKEDIYESHTLLERFYIDKFEELGKYNKFCNLLEKQVDRIVELKAAAFSIQLDALKRNYPDAPILSDIEANIDDRNFVVAEEYISRLQSGVTELDEEELAHTDCDVEIERFLGMYDSIFKVANEDENRTNKFSAWAKSEYEKRRRNNATQSDEREAIQYFEAWDRERDVGGLLAQLGFAVNGVDSIKDHYVVRVTPSSKNRPSFSHPISAFGTACKEINVLCFKGGNKTDRVIEEVAKLNPRGKATIVIFYAALTRAQREDILRKFKNTTKENSFLLLDYTLGFYLSLVGKGNRLTALLKCTVPYTGYKLYADDARVPPEMFTGRENEQRKITDMNDGTTLVYGGRRLGKTALFTRACEVENDHKNGKYAVYINVDKSDGDGDNFFVEKVSDELMRNGLIPNGRYKTNKDICDKLREKLVKSETKAVYLFVDEVNDYFEKLNEDKDTSALVPFNDLHKKMPGKFKYVFAGLHHVARYSQFADNNTVIGQMSMPLVVKPLTPRETRWLIEYPFSYLGIKIEPQLIALLASRANYYPGNIQMICQRIVETILNNPKLSPPYVVDEKLLEVVCGEADINNEIKRKLLYTLKLDKTYQVLAYLFTHFYYEDGYSSDGYDARRVLKEAQSLDIACMKHMEITVVEALLEELVNMSILRKIKSKGYKLRKASFAELIESNKEDVDEYLLSLSESE